LPNCKGSTYRGREEWEEREKEEEMAEEGKGGKEMGSFPGSSDAPGCRGARIVSAQYRRVTARSAIYS